MTDTQKLAQLTEVLRQFVTTLESPEVIVNRDFSVLREPLRLANELLNTKPYAPPVIKAACLPVVPDRSA